MKKPAAVIAAQAVLAEKEEALNAAKELVSRLHEEFGAAYRALLAAQDEADAGFPQCDVVSISRYSGKEALEGRVAILRKTPTGMLVVRPVGRPEAGEVKFEWAKCSARFVPKKKSVYYTASSRMLKGVPLEFMPADYVAETEEAA